MRTERCVELESEGNSVFQVALRQRRSKPEVEHLLERSPEPFDDGDRARLANRSESLLGSELAEFFDEGLAGELRALIADEMGGLAIAIDGSLNESRDLLAGWFLREDLEGEREARVDVENDDELEDPKAEETGHVRDIGRPDMIGFPGADRERGDVLAFAWRSGSGQEQRSRLAVATHGLATDLDTGAGEHLGDGLAAANAHEVEIGDELPGDVVERAKRRGGFEQRPDGGLVRLTCGLVNPARDRLRINEKRLRRFLERDAVRSDEENDAKALLGRVAFPLGRRHAREATVKNFVDLTDLSELDLGLAVFGERARDRVARLAPLAEDKPHRERDLLFEPKKELDLFGGKVAHLDQRGESTGVEHRLVFRVSRSRWIQEVGLSERTGETDRGPSQMRIRNARPQGQNWRAGYDRIGDREPQCK